MSAIKEPLVTYNVAKLAEEKGFRSTNILTAFDNNGKPGILNYAYSRSGVFHWDDPKDGYGIFSYMTLNPKEQPFAINGVKFEFSFIYRPTQALLKKWLRDVHNLSICIDNVNTPMKGKWIFEINKLPVGVIVLWDKNISPIFETYEEALEAGLLEGLKLIELC